MAKGCEICGKTAVSGNRVSHANNATRRRWHPNLKTARAAAAGGNRRIHVCTRCLRSGKVVKPLAPASR